MRNFLWLVLILEAGFLLWYALMAVLFISDMLTGRENGVGTGLLLFFIGSVLDKTYRTSVLVYVLHRDVIEGNFLVWSILGYIVIVIFRAFAITYLTYALFSDRIKLWLRR